MPLLCQAACRSEAYIPEPKNCNFQFVFSLLINRSRNTAREGNAYRSFRFFAMRQLGSSKNCRILPCRYREGAGTLDVRVLIGRFWGGLGAVLSDLGARACHAGAVRPSSQVKRLKLCAKIEATEEFVYAWALLQPFAEQPYRRRVGLHPIEGQPEKTMERQQSSTWNSAALSNDEQSACSTRISNIVPIGFSDSECCSEKEVGMDGKPYSDNLRVPVVTAMGRGMNCREAGALFGVAPSTAGTGIGGIGRRGACRRGRWAATDARSSPAMVRGSRCRLTGFHTSREMIVKYLLEAHQARARKSSSGENQVACLQRYTPNQTLHGRHCSPNTPRPNAQHLPFPRPTA